MGLTLNSTNLVRGRDIWIANCLVCHLEGLGGAPVIGNSKAWSWRIDKTIDTFTRTQSKVSTAIMEKCQQEVVMTIWTTQRLNRQ